MDNLNRLKPALFGRYYDKQSVLNYIFELNSSAKAVQDKLSAQFEELSAARENLAGNIKELELRLNDSEKSRVSLGEELKGERAKNSDMGVMLNNLNSEIERQNKIIAQKTIELSRVDEIKKELEEKRSELSDKNQFIEEKLKEAAVAEDIRGELERVEALLESKNGELALKEQEASELRGELELLQSRLAEQCGADSGETDKLRRALEAERQESSRREQEIERYREELTDRDIRLSERGGSARDFDALRLEIEKLRGEADRLNRKLTGREAEIAHLRGHMAGQAQRRAEAARPARQISEIILQAKEDAERIIADANHKARQAASEVNRSLDMIVGQLSRFRREIRYLEEKTGDAIDGMRKSITPAGRYPEGEESFFHTPPRRNGGTASRTGRTSASEPRRDITPGLDFEEDYLYYKSAPRTSISDKIRRREKTIPKDFLRDQDEPDSSVRERRPAPWQEEYQGYSAPDDSLSWDEEPRERPIIAEINID